MSRSSLHRAALVVVLSLPACEPALPPAKPAPAVASALPAPAAAAELLAPSRVVLLPEAEQRPHWRRLAASESAAPSQRGEALRQLALLRDDEAAKHAMASLAAVDGKLRVTAARVLAHIGAPAAEQAKPALRSALRESSSKDRAEIVWALVEIGDASVADAAIEMVVGGELRAVRRLDGGQAYDPRRLAAVLSPKSMIAHAGDGRAPMRRLVALALSYKGEGAADAGTALERLAADPEPTVARQAAVGLARLGTKRARATLVRALRHAPMDEHRRLVTALRDGAGGKPLVLALDAIDTGNEQSAWLRRRQLLEMLQRLADPRAGDALVSWLQQAGAHEHWRGEAAMALGVIGDIRAAEHLGRRMRHGRSLYDKAKHWQADRGGHLSRTDRPRVVSSRLLGALADIHPDKHAELLRWAEAPVLAWLAGRPHPHANGMRFLAAAGSKLAVALLRDWAFPTDPLPTTGAMPPFPAAFETAQSALRYIGKLRDGPSLHRLLAQFDRNDAPRMDITHKALMSGGIAMRGMALRSVAYGAAQGLSEWAPQGQPRVAARLFAFIEDHMWHEEAREAACEALPWVASESQLAEVVASRLPRRMPPDSSPQDRFIASCYAVALSRRSWPGLSEQLVGLLRAELSDASPRIALALGRSGVKPGSTAEARLLELSSGGELRVAATMALMLGGSRAVAARAVANIAADGPALDELKDAYYRALGFWSHEDLSSGAVYRWATNARAITRVGLAAAERHWTEQRFASQLDNVIFDNGPHSITRPVLRHRVLQQARSGDAAQRDSAIVLLGLMKEQGTLMALCDERVRGSCHELQRLLHPPPAADKSD